ncbi:UPF0619 GPI-anchored membrane protein AFUA_3G00880 [Colletotrichum liriopes]|uniref:UPF0619 GPI-anchored membrane protein AFUA_3G00880 n=1 Tax=Colletotrichum liriopes TaxID=708192 RepID=A0AA37LUB5_9PEZI|nr:UPF0619 GPI-anchored membrane protein AFUA_3G00880 [Colletotrichum liriopes]
MFSKTAVAITSLLALAEAVKVTKPAKGDDWEISSTNEITWETVDSDPTSFEIVIVNQSGYPPVSEKIAKVNAADGKYELKDVKVAAGDAYRINLVSTQNSGILAQSDEFSLTSDGKLRQQLFCLCLRYPSASASGSASASATGSSSSASGSTATATVTQTSSGLTTVTGSATASASGTAASNASGSGTASGTATGSAASGTSTTAPNSASGLKSTFAIFGSVAVAAYMLF